MEDVNSRSAWLSYSLLRIAFFAVPFGVLYAIGWTWWLALIVATLISVALSVLILHKQRSRASESIYTWRTRAHTADDIAEDAVLDAIPDSSVGEPGSGDTNGGYTPAPKPQQ
jgi:hypothetical protein